MITKRKNYGLVMCYYGDSEYNAYYRLDRTRMFSYRENPSFNPSLEWIILKKGDMPIFDAWKKDNTCLEYHDFFYSSCSWRWSPFTGLFPEFHKYNYRVKKEAMINGVVYCDKYKAIEKINSLFPDEL